MNHVRQPVLSIVIPCYNASAFLPDTLRSLQSQISTDVEVILVDDGSTDDTSEIVGPFLSENIRYYAQSNSGGPASPRNVGIEKARGSLVGFFDSDDVAINDHFLAGIKLMVDNPSVGMVCGNFHISDESLNISRPRVLDRYAKLQAVLTTQVGEGSWLLRSEVALNVLLQSNFVGTPGVIIRESVFDKVGKFDESLRNIDDLDMWLRVARHYDLIYRDEPVFIYRSVPTSISKQGLERQALEKVRVCKKLLSTGLPSVQRRLARQWISRNYLDAGYIQFECASKRVAQRAFLRSFLYSPSWAAFKGTVKSVLPGAVYRSIRRVKP